MQMYQQVQIVSGHNRTSHHYKSTIMNVLNFVASELLPSPGFQIKNSHFLKCLYVSKPLLRYTYMHESVPVVPHDVIHPYKAMQ